MTGGVHVIRTDAELRRFCIIDILVERRGPEQWSVLNKKRRAAASQGGTSGNRQHFCAKSGIPALSGAPTARPARTSQRARIDKARAHS